MENNAYNDVKGLFIELLNQEEFALNIYSNIINELENGEVKDVILSIFKDEQRHVANAKEILKIINE